MLLGRLSNHALQGTRQLAKRDLQRDIAQAASSQPATTSAHPFLTNSTSQCHTSVEREMRNPDPSDKVAPMSGSTRNERALPAGLTGLDLFASEGRQAQRGMM